MSDFGASKNSLLIRPLFRFLLGWLDVIVVLSTSINVFGSSNKTGIRRTMFRICDKKIRNRSFKPRAFRFVSEFEGATLGVNVEQWAHAGVADQVAREVGATATIIGVSPATPLRNTSTIKHLKGKTQNRHTTKTFEKKHRGPKVLADLNKRCIPGAKNFGLDISIATQNHFGEPPMALSGGGIKTHCSTSNL